MYANLDVNALLYTHSCMCLRSVSHHACSNSVYELHIILQEQLQIKNLLSILHMRIWKETVWQSATKAGGDARRTAHLCTPQLQYLMQFLVWRCVRAHSSCVGCP